ncbi:MAG: InlB B-repeat-containing protein, partial [Desulfocapsa sp.]|nr:InlB B-repeat-containing protein [Desulfocapsa sp.]
ADNSSTSAHGGGVYSRGGTTTISTSTVARNKAGSQGGGLYFYQSTAGISNSTISSNTAPQGSGVYSQSGTTTLSNSTVAYNVGGYGIENYYNSTTTNLISTIVGNNSPYDVQKGSQSTLTSDHSLIEDPTGHDISDGDGNGNIVGHDPMLYPLGDYGGLTETHTILDGSPVISTGDNPQPLTTDQRGTGFDRIVDSVDMGAVEYNANTSLTVTRNGNGAGIVSGTPGSIDCGTNCSEMHDPNVSIALSASPQTGSSFAGWTGDCAGTGVCVISMAQARTVNAEFNLIPYDLTVAVEGGGSGTITSAPSGIDCGSDCTETFNYNTSVTLTANIPYGSTFVGWSEASCTGTDPCTVIMDGHRSISATISLNQYQLSVAKDGLGTVSSDLPGIYCGSDCQEEYDYNTSLTLTAVADIGYTFSGWSEPSCTGVAPCAVTIDQARSVLATFILDTHELSVTKTGDGTVSSNPAGIDCGADCSEMYDYATAVLLTAEPAIGSDFSGWTGGCSGTGNCSLSMESDHHVGAVFSLETYTLTVTLEGSGTGEVTSEPAGIACGADCEETFDYGTEITLTAAPQEQSVFIGWSGACSGVDPCTITIDKAKEVSAGFDASFPWTMFLPAIIRTQQ